MTNANEPAMPISEEATDRVDANVKIYTGLTKREYFAAMAMQGMAASDYWSQNFSNKNQDYLPDAMKVAVQAADTLIDALNKPADQ